MNSEAIEFKLMTFNIEYGGTNVSFEKVVEAIRKTNPHVVAIEEAFGNIPRLASELGWKYFDIRLQIVSQLPLLDPPEGNGIYTFVQLAPGRVAAISNAHLPNDPEGSFAVMRGASAEEIVELEKRARLPFIVHHLEVLQRLASQGIPVFLAGDFNAPSHLDWTENMVGHRKQIRYPLEWPVSKAVMDAGFRDSFRDVHPDPIIAPGLTWWADRPKVAGWNPNPDDPCDRIDFIYAAGHSETLSSRVIGGETVSPYPSDHRAVSSAFSVKPANTPVLISTDRRLVSVGENMHVAYHGSGSGGERCGIAHKGESLPVMSLPLDREKQTDGVLSISTKGLEKGAYDLVLLAEGGKVLSRYPFWLKDVNETARLVLGKSVYAGGEPITVTWENAPGHRWDWLGIYKAGQDLFVEKAIRYQHTQAAIAGSITFESTGLDAGEYEILFCVDDDYVCLARVPFAIKD